MRQSLYFAMLGLILMVTGVITTYVAFGQSENDASSEDAPAATMTPTLTPEIEPVVVEPTVAVDNAQPVAPAVVEVVPTVEMPTALPASPVPTEAPVENVVPMVTEAPTETVAEEVLVEPTATDLLVEAVVPAEAINPTSTEVIVESGPVEAVEPTPESPAGDVVVETPVETVIDVSPTETVAEEVPVEPVVVEPTATVIPAEEVGPAEVVNPTPTEVVAEVVPVEPTPEAPAGEVIVAETPVETVIDEAPMEPTAVLEPTAVIPVESTVDAAAVGDVLNAAAIDPPGATPELPHVDPGPLFTPTVETEQQPAIVEVEVTPATDIPVELVATATVSETIIEPTIEPTAVIEELPAVDAAALEAASTLGMVSGQVNMTHRVGAISLLLTQPDGSIVEAVTDETGSFVFEALQPGDYDLIASSPGFLSKAVAFTLLDGETLALPVTALNAGDLNQDNQIDLRDVVLIAANYNGPAVIAEADLNGDEWIDISDLTIIGARFGLSGPVAWE